MASIYTVANIVKLIITKKSGTCRQLLSNCKHNAVKQNTSKFSVSNKTGYDLRSISDVLNRRKFRHHTDVLHGKVSDTVSLVLSFTVSREREKYN